MQNERESIGPVRRRRLLRAGGAAVAGVVGAGVVGAVAATPAQAAPGDPVTAGSAGNDSGAATTALTSSSSNGTLALANSASSVDGTLTVGGSALVLKPHPTADYIDGPVGSLGVSKAGHLYTVDSQGPAFVRTSNNSMEVFASAPKRVLDTRVPAERINVMNAAQCLSPANGYKLLANTPLHLDLSRYLVFGDAVFLTVTAVDAANYGYLVVYPYTGTAVVPAASTLNYAPNVAIATLAVCKLGFTNTDKPAISIWSNRMLNVIVDCVAAVTTHAGNLTANASGASAGAAAPTVTR